MFAGIISLDFSCDIRIVCQNLTYTHESTVPHWLVSTVQPVPVMYNNDTSDIFLAYVGPHIFIIFVELKQAEFGKTCVTICENCSFIYIL